MMEKLWRKHTKRRLGSMISDANDDRGKCNRSIHEEVYGRVWRSHEAGRETFGQWSRNGVGAEIRGSYDIYVDSIERLVNAASSQRGYYQILLEPRLEFAPVHHRFESEIRSF
jgi:hypothetical protein